MTNNSVLLANLRNAGWKTHITHYREYDDVYEDHEVLLKLSQKGGQTDCSIIKGNIEVLTVARCHPNDQFTKKIGTNLALERAAAIARAIDTYVPPALVGERQTQLT